MGGTGTAGMCVLLCASWTREVIDEHTSVDGPNLGRHVVVAFIRYRLRQILMGYVLLTTVAKCLALSVYRNPYCSGCHSHCADSSRTAQISESKHPAWGRLII